MSKFNPNLMSLTPAMQRQIAPPELCGRLEKMGCVSTMGFRWAQNHETGLFEIKFHPEISGMFTIFVQNDFTGTEAQAKQNAIIAWGTEIVNSEYQGGPRVQVTAWWHHRHVMIETSDWAGYLERTMKNG